MRSSTLDAARRAFLGVVRGVVMATDDSTPVQTMTVRGLHGEMLEGVERLHHYGFTSVPVPPDGNGAQGPEPVVVFVNGNRAHPIVVGVDDRRSRPTNLKPGESKHFDDQGQNTHLARDGVYHTAKQHVMSATAGSQPLTDYEANDQWKGLEARTAHLEHSLHGLFDVTSRLNTIAMGVIPALSQLQPILNQAPNGLTMMTQAIVGKEAAYLQQHIQDALGKFLSPTITGVGSVLGGADGIIAALQSQISGLMSANPVVATVDGLVSELAALQSSGSPAVVAAMAPPIQGLIDSATASNPIIGQVAQLRSELAGLISAAGDGLNFLAPQQRLPQRLTKSLKLAQ